MSLPLGLVSAHSYGTDFSRQDLINELPGRLDLFPRTEPGVLEVESDADLGHAKVITGDLLRAISLYLPLRARLALRDRVCKTWKRLLSADGTMFKEIKISTERYGKDNTLDPDAVRTHEGGERRTYGSRSINTIGYGNRFLPRWSSDITHSLAT